MGKQLSQIINFLPLSDRLATAGQPTAEQYPAIRAAGYQVVINLALPTSANALPNEAALAQALGLEYIAIPVEWDNPTLDDFQQFLEAMRSHPHQAIFVHCAMNMRVSAFMYAYHRIIADRSATAAQTDLEKIWIPNPTWQAWIQQVLNHYGISDAS